MAIENLSDKSVLMLYDNVRAQVLEDFRLGSRHRLLGDSARQQAQRLQDELVRRRLKFSPIDWR